MAQNMNQSNISLLDQWLASGGQGDLPAGWNGGGGGATGDGSSDIISAATKGLNLSAADKAALDNLKLSSLNYNSFENEALNDLVPYYTRLLEESNYDVNTAKQRLEEDYQTGMRTGKQDASTSLRELIGVTKPSEDRSMLNSLNQRGLLDGTTPQKQDSSTVELPDASKVVDEPVTRANFTGLGGNEMDKLRQSQATRQEAINRALKRSEDASTLNKNRKVTDLNTQKTRSDANLQQQKTTDAASLAAQRYQRALQTKELQRNEILDPYLNGYS